mgnify:CR=1 FL=1
MPEYSERFFRSGTLRIHFRDCGDAANPPLVIVHGLRDHSHSFDQLARGLLDRFHVLALDLRGLTETQARELALLGTRAREDGKLEWRFDSIQRSDRGGIRHAPRARRIPPA